MKKNPELNFAKNFGIPAFFFADAGPGKYICMMGSPASGPPGESGMQSNNGNQKLSRHVDEDGTVRWRLPNGQLHRIDGPAVELADGSKMWYQNGKLHRDDGPAVEGKENKRWYQDGFLHRDDGPAIEWPSGTKTWYRNGLRHRTDGPADEWADGTKYWLQNGSLHRLDGPAAEYPDGTKYWYQNGKKHRLDGPAAEYADGTKEYWIRGKQVSEQDLPNKAPGWYKECLNVLARAASRKRP